MRSKKFIKRGHVLVKDVACGTHICSRSFEDEKNSCSWLMRAKNTKERS